MQISGLVGQPAAYAPGTNNVPVRTGSLGSIIQDQLHGSYYETSYRGNMFRISNQAVVSTTAGLATTWTGLAIANPTGSGVNAVINLFTCAQVAAGVAGAVGIMTGVGAAAGSLVPKNAVIGGPTGKVTASAGATIATPVLDIVVGSIGSVATTAYGLSASIALDLQGSIVVPPGFFAATYTTAATTSALVFGFQWEEVPV